MRNARVDSRKERFGPFNPLLYWCAGVRLRRVTVHLGGIEHVVFTAQQQTGPRANRLLMIVSAVFLTSACETLLRKQAL